MTIKGALKELSDLLEAEDIPVWYKTSIKKVMETIEMESMPRMGNWVHHCDDFNDWLVCCKCGFGSEGEIEYGKGTKYCPNCGSYMKNWEKNWEKN